MANVEIKFKDGNVLTFYGLSKISLNREYNAYYIESDTQRGFIERDAVLYIVPVDIMNMAIERKMYEAKE